MEQVFHFCRAADGIRIAYTTYVDLPGTPVVFVNPWFHPEEPNWEDPAMHAWYEEVAKRWRLISYDRRGIGESQRDVSDLSLDAQVADLSAVVDHANLQQFHLAGFVDGAAVAGLYAVAHPERVKRLVLSGLHAKGADAWDSGVAETLKHSIEISWPAARVILGELAWQDLPADRRRARSRALERSISQRTALEYVRLWTDYDLREVLPRIEVPTLVMHWQASRRLLDSAKEVASLVPDARFVIARSEGPENRLMPMLRPFMEFLSEGDDRLASIASGTATVLFADIASSTSLTEEMGDAAFREAARELESAARLAITEAGGSVVEGKLLGDGLLAVFASARPAIEAALACGELIGGERLRLHMGVHAGDLIREGGTVYGGTVNMAARVCDQAGAGEVLVSRTVRDLARTSSGVHFEDHATFELKGIAEPQQLFAVRRRAS